MTEEGKIDQIEKIVQGLVQENKILRKRLDLAERKLEKFELTDRILTKHFARSKEASKPELKEKVGRKAEKSKEPHETDQSQESASEGEEKSTIKKYLSTETLIKLLIFSAFLYYLYTKFAWYVSRMMKKRKGSYDPSLFSKFKGQKN